MDDWNSLPGSWNSLPDSWNSFPDSWNSLPDSWNNLPDPWKIISDCIFDVANTDKFKVKLDCPWIREYYVPLL